MRRIDLYVLSQILPIMCVTLFISVIVLRHAVHQRHRPAA